jgi:Fe-S oxidoreductase
VSEYVWRCCGVGPRSGSPAGMSLETCTGDPARRAGDEFHFQMLAQAVETINEAFGDRNTRKIVVTCPHCFNTLSNEYGDLGGHYEVIHNTQLLNRLVRDRHLVLKKDPPKR